MKNLKFNQSVEKLYLKWNMNDDSVLKHYFGEYPVKIRKDIKSNILLNLASKGSSTMDDFNDAAFAIRNHMDKETAENMPFLIDSIILNTLGFEANERLEKTIYKDYQNKAIKKSAKQFIAGQFKIFSNEYEQIFNTTEDETQKVLDDTLRIIEIIRDRGMHSMLELENVLEAHAVDPKSINGIANKINKIKVA